MIGVVLASTTLALAAPGRDYVGPHAVEADPRAEQPHLHHDDERAPEPVVPTHESEPKPIAATPPPPPRERFRYLGFSLSFGMMWGGPLIDHYGDVPSVSIDHPFGSLAVWTVPRFSFGTDAAELTLGVHAVGPLFVELPRPVSRIEFDSNLHAIGGNIGALFGPPWLKAGPELIAGFGWFAGGGLRMVWRSPTAAVPFRPGVGLQVNWLTSGVLEAIVAFEWMPKPRYGRKTGPRRRRRARADSPT